MGWLHHYLHDPVAVIGTVAAIAVAWLLSFFGRKYFDAHVYDPKEHYRKISFLNTALIVGVVVVIAALWSRLFHAKGTFWGLIGAGVAVALKDPLLSIAGRIAIFAGHIYSVGDRIQITQLTGDVVDVGFFYTRMMELGNWIGGDQATGRMVQFSNSIIFGNPVYNYTQNFSYIWDEIQLPVTYASNVQEASKILLEVGKQYTHEFLEGAQAQMRRMQRYFLVPEFELEPTVYLQVTSNWVQLTLRYLVEPKKRRSATNFIYTEVFKRVQQRKDISIASETMDLAVHPPQSGSQEPDQPKAA
ncbi:MAG TPA: mechanosensitive ion channel family protein [Terriglobales bacterium]|nr:mechanosensitive ion channel family protein [Terriglobales bacterium]